MVSRRNLFTITVVMLVVFCMFQIPEVIKNRVNHYGKNEYETQADTGLYEKSVYRASAEDVKRAGRFVVYIGDGQDDAIGSVVTEWCFYTKRYLECYSSVGAYEPDDVLMPEAVLIDSAFVDFGKDMDMLTEFAERGIDLIFCSLPDVSVVKENSQLKRLLGIRQVLFDEVDTAGIMLLNGFLLGGQKQYIVFDPSQEPLQDFDLTMPWYRVSSGTKTYMYAVMPQETTALDNEDFPAVIWRNGFGNAKVFAVNGDYLSVKAGIGILGAMIYEKTDYDIYPVINAQNLVVLNFPDLTDENTDEVMAHYSQTLKAVYRDVVWPGLVSVAQQNSLKMTCMITPQMDDTKQDNAPEEDTLVYYMKLFQEQDAEAGLSGTHRDGTDVLKKIDSDSSFIGNVVPDYKILSFYQGNMTKTELTDALELDTLSHIRTVFADYEETEQLVAYVGTSQIRQSGITNGASHTFAEDLRMVSLQTALGYSNIQLDISPVAFPENKEDSWEKMVKDFASYTNTYWKQFKTFEKTTLAESYTHVQKFLALNYLQERQGDTITLNVTGLKDEAWFILRTHGEEIGEARGARFEEIEKDAYLITVTDSKAVFTMEKSEEAYYYEGKFLENTK